MQGWWPADSSDTLLQDAFKSVYESSQWIVESSNISTASLLTEPVSIEQDSLSTYSYLHPGPGSAVFPFSDEITTSFYPMLEKQYLLPTISSKINSVYQYFEYNMGRLFDSDGDSVMDSYQYNTLLRQCGDNATCETGDYSVWASANLLISMTWPNSNPNFLKSLFHPDMPLFQRYVEQPKVRINDSPIANFGLNDNFCQVLSVEFPHVMVRSATYTTLASVEHDDSFNSSKAPNGSLKFELLPGDNYPRLPHDVVLRGSIDYVLSMKLNGEDYSDFRSGTKNTIIIMAPGWGQCDDDVIFEFTVLFMAAGA